MRVAASAALLFAGLAAAQVDAVTETNTVTVPETTTTVWVPIPEETESISLVPVDTTSWVRYWPEIESSTVITSTIYGAPNATGWDESSPSHPTAAAGRAAVGGSFAAFIGFGVAGLLLL